MLVVVVLVVVEVAYVPPVVEVTEVPLAVDGSKVVVVETGEFDCRVNVGV